MIEFIVGVAVGYVAAVLLILYGWRPEWKATRDRNQLEFDFDQLRRRR